MTSNNNQQKLFREEDLQDLLRHTILPKSFTMEKVTKKVYLELAQTFIEQVLDLPTSEKMNLSKEVIARQIGVKFPEIARGDPSIETSQKRNMEIQREDIY